jgi:hypothetical protein
MIWTKPTCKLMSIEEQAASTKVSSPCPLPLLGLPAENMVNRWRALHRDNKQQLTAALCEPGHRTLLNCPCTRFVSQKRQFHRIVVELDDGEAVIWIDQRIEGAFHEHQVVNPVVFIAKCGSPLSIPNAAVVEDVAP